MYTLTFILWYESLRIVLESATIQQAAVAASLHPSVFDKSSVCDCESANEIIYYPSTTTIHHHHHHYMFIYIENGRKRKNICMCTHVHVFGEYSHKMR